MREFKVADKYLEIETDDNGLFMVYADETLIAEIQFQVGPRGQQHSEDGLTESTLLAIVIEQLGKRPNKLRLDAAAKLKEVQSAMQEDFHEILPPVEVVVGPAQTEVKAGVVETSKPVESSPAPVTSIPVSAVPETTPVKPITFNPLSGSGKI